MLSKSLRLTIVIIYFKEEEEEGDNFFKIGSNVLNAQSDTFEDDWSKLVAEAQQQDDQG